MLFIESWLKKGFEDVDHSCSSKIKEFVGVISDSESERMEEQAAAIIRLVDDPEYVGRTGPSITTVADWVFRSASVSQKVLHGYDANLLHDLQV